MQNKLPCASHCLRNISYLQEMLFFSPLVNQLCNLVYHSFFSSLQSLHNSAWFFADVRNGGEGRGRSSAYRGKVSRSVIGSPNDEQSILAPWVRASGSRGSHGAELWRRRSSGDVNGGVQWVPLPSTGQDHKAPMCEQNLPSQQDFSHIWNLDRENHSQTMTRSRLPLLGAASHCLTPGELPTHGSQEPWVQGREGWLGCALCSCFSACRNL